MNGNRAVFFDLDGTLVRTRDDNLRGPRTIEEVQFLTSRNELRALREAGYRLFAITNQPDIDRGLLPPLEHLGVRLFVQFRLGLDCMLFCPHDGDWCACRKPRPGLIWTAAVEFELDLSRCWVVGDRERDIAAGRAAGCSTYRIDTDQGITEATRWILNH